MITHRRFVPRHSGEERLDSACTVAIGYNVERFANGRNNVRTIELEGADNIRDLGGMPVAGNRRIAKGLLFRGSALAGITERDMQLLFGELGIKRVIDVRTGWERAAKPDIQAPGVEYLHIPFYDIEKVGIEYTEPAAGTKVIGRDVACDPDLFYRSLANPLTVRQMREGLHSMLDSAIAGRPVYVHCSGGKDRAGILALLALTVLGADHNAILDDYLLTNVARDKNYEKTYARFLRLADGDEERARELTYAHRARPENLVAFREAVDESYGNMEAFMRDELSVDDGYRMQAREACTEPIL